ncbi:MAG TPA: tripartite tricarboxylate transporter substrate-binding protein [Reyranella sp.]|jgi:tripartite-type tricarboxylate transporter receptor subunit TctC|nr:tripartite tricarboxylate transporter substrate-binding protein [Reyranella sp.]
MSPVRLGRRTFLTVAALAAPAIARADSYPKTSVRVVNAYSPGGTADVVCRILCQALSEKLGQSFTVDNKPGAAGTIAAQIVARAPNDGYTLLYDATAHSVNPSLFSKLPYDTRRDLLPVFLSLQTPNTLMRNAHFEANTIPELIALAKSKPGALDCATTGIGTVQHVSLELLNQRAGIKINHVPYKEMGSVRNDLFAGRIPLQFSNVPGTISLRASKDVTCMAHTGPGPIDVLPGIHGIAEVLPGFETWEWNGVFAPAGTDPGLITHLNEEMNAAFRVPAVSKRLAELGALTRPNTVAEFTAFRETQIAFFADMVKKADIHIE